MSIPERSFSAVPGSGDLPDHEDDHDVVVPTTAAGSPLEALREEIAKEAKRKPIELGTEERPGFAVRYSTDITMERLSAWQKASKDTSYEGGVDPMRLASICLANCCDALLYGNAVIEDAGERVTFRSRSFHEQAGVVDPLQAVEWWYGSDGVILVTFGKVMEAAGFDENTVTRDPTQPL